MDKRHFFRGTGEQAVIFRELGNTKFCVQIIENTVIKNLFLEETQNGMVLVTLALVWCVLGCFN